MNTSEYEGENLMLFLLNCRGTVTAIRKLANRDQVDSIAENVSIVWYRKVTYL